ncbi:MAG: cytochrome c [Chromatiaceae bacterium]|nr:cytochrome c [Chromatiaceae bacterium]MCP5445816.1 cytochrome c [Chromatiaceae bacterium]
MKLVPPLLFLTLTVIGSSQVLAFDPAAGQQLVDDNCDSCHGTEVYTRKDRMVKSRAGLTTQVKRCELALGLTWFDEDVENAAEYLNRQFYRFDK